MLLGVTIVVCVRNVMHTMIFYKPFYLNNSPIAPPRGFPFTSPFSSNEGNDWNAQGRKCIFAVMGEVNYNPESFPGRFLNPMAHLGDNQFQEIFYSWAWCSDLMVFTFGSYDVIGPWLFDCLTIAFQSPFFTRSARFDLTPQSKLLRPLPNLRA